jgi:hypothetical protein
MNDITTIIYWNIIHPINPSHKNPSNPYYPINNYPIFNHKERSYHSWSITQFR